MWTFRFDRGSPPYEWTAGQNLVMTIPGLEDPKGPTRPITISSSPTEGGFLAITTIVRESPFKQRLAAMRPGDEVVLDGPEGDFVLKPGRPAVFLAGGIGITPFRSMMRFATDSHLDKPLSLIYSARTAADLVFRKELDELQRRNPAIHVLYTVTRHQESDGPWSGRVGHIDATMVRDALRGIRHPLVYLAGPPGLVASNRQLFAEEVHVPASDILTDEFDGY